MDKMSRRFSSKAVVAMSVREGVSADAIHKTLDRIFEESGCTACGLLGFDLSILTIDDDWSRQFGKVLQISRVGPAVEGVEAVAVFGG
jgi:hypothetical protein